jgi:hypothetical protein
MYRFRLFSLLIILTLMSAGCFATLTSDDSSENVVLEDNGIPGTQLESDVKDSSDPAGSESSEDPSTALEMTDIHSESDKLVVDAPRLPVRGLKTDTSKASIGVDQILSGGPGKDGIPAINDPKFTSIAEAGVDDEVLGMYVEIDGEGRFYPYTILVWHEIVNDSIGDTDFAVTFCPLCGSAIVFDRSVGGETVRFGVSGLLYESNLLMYDSKTESLWSQARGDAVVGEMTGTELTRLPMQLIPFSELKEKFPDAEVLSADTGYRRNYGFYPYGDYEESDSFVFDPSIKDNRFHVKKMMYVTPYKDRSLAFPYEDIPSGVSTINLGGVMAELERDGAQIMVRVGGQDLVGYFEMWFSWAVHHQEDGVVWVP